MMVLKRHRTLWREFAVNQRFIMPSFVALLIFAGGCSTYMSSSSTDEHLEHHMAEHRPPNFPAALSEIRHRLAVLMHDGTDGTALHEHEAHEHEPHHHATHDHHSHGHDHGIHDHTAHSHGGHDHGSDEHATHGHGSHEHSEIDLFMQLQDIARWLPEIAADSDLPEAEWNVVNDSAKQLQQLLKEAAAKMHNSGHFVKTGGDFEPILHRLAEVAAHHSSGVTKE